MEELVQKLITWIKDQATAANSRGVVLGLSGGLDSSVAAVLCQKAFPQNTLGVLIPCHSAKIDLEHAHLIAQKFNISTTTIVLDAVFGTVPRLT